jgi:serine/threonine protein kinase
MTTIQKDGLANIPKTFGKYRIGRVIGEGGTSIVAEAFDRETGQSYAVKIIGKGEKMTKNVSAAVEREIRVLKRLNHPNIVKLIEVVREEKNIFVVLENCEGGSLLNHILSGAKMGLAEVVRVFRQIASAVGYLHSEGIAHGDLKPDNIVLTKSGEVKLIDFGYCKEDVMSGDGDKSGTIKYAPPEFFRRGLYNPRKADMWSLGIVLFVMVTGSFPYYTSEDAIVRDLIAEGRMVPVSRIGPEFADVYRVLTNRFPRLRPNVEVILGMNPLAESDKKEEEATKKAKPSRVDVTVELGKTESETAIDNMDLY